jgi:hypothetical protein
MVLFRNPSLFLYKWRNSHGDEYMRDFRHARPVSQRGDVYWSRDVPTNHRSHRGMRGWMVQVRFVLPKTAVWGQSVWNYR